MRNRRLIVLNLLSVISVLVASPARAQFNPSVPIRVPMGTLGMQPELSLVVFTECGQRNCRHGLATHGALFHLSGQLRERHQLVDGELLIGSISWISRSCYDALSCVI
jgi:hypothetical protein